MGNDEKTKIQCIHCHMRFWVVEGTEHMVNHCPRCGRELE